MGAQVLGILVTIVIVGFLWFYIARPILEDFGIISPRESVNDSQIIMSRPVTPPQRTEQTNERTNERSPHDLLWRAFLLDRTRTRLIAVMVDSDLTVSEIRNLLKGESAAIGLEVEAARSQQGKEPTQPYRTPIAGRVTDPRNYQDDPDLVYQPPN